MENTFPSLNEVITLFFTCKGRDTERELTPEEVQACADWMEDHRPTLSQTLMELGCLAQLLGKPVPRLSLAALGHQTDQVVVTTFGNLLDQEELVHETDPEAWTWEAWSQRHREPLLRLLLLAMLQLEMGWPRIAQGVRTGFPWPEGLRRTWRESP
jgi:hypothetical protein